MLIPASQLSRIRRQPGDMFVNWNLHFLTAAKRKVCQLREYECQQLVLCLCVCVCVCVCVWQLRSRGVAPSSSVSCSVQPVLAICHCRPQAAAPRLLRGTRGPPGVGQHAENSRTSVRLRRHSTTRCSPEVSLPGLGFLLRVCGATLPLLRNSPGSGPAFEIKADQS